jgi:membrane-associated phospholipid phosphatase
MTKDDLMQMKVIVLVLGCVASSLTLTAPSSMPAPPQVQEQRAVDAKESTSGAEVKKMTPAKKIARDPEAEAFESSQRGFEGLGKRFLEDQKQIWTSPARLRFPDTDWLVPLSGITAGLFVTDRVFSKHLSQNPSTISHYKTLSNAGVGALIGGAGGMWLLGHVRHNEHWSETGFLAGEAALNSLVMVEGLKYSLRRERPYQGDGSGPFFQSAGTSFPSEHAAAAWSVAGVIAHEYPGPFTKIMAYGLASLVSVSRVKAHQHFPSDVVVGSVIGNLIAQDIYSRHHDFELGGGEWRSISQIFRGDESSSPANLGSPYVPLDSWVYPALDRLIGMGMIDSGFSGVRPWTRSECTRLLTEASGRVDGGPAEAHRIYQLLEAEFKDELEGASTGSPFRARLESVYTRFTEISGKPLTDGYDFGQTLINDFGRPYERGFNSVTGFSAWTTAGRWVGYVRGEYQQSPFAPALPESARLFISKVDPVPEPPATPISSVNQPQLLDAYVGLNLNNWQVTFGQQSLSWGPGDGGSLDLSYNSPPIKMFRINRITPLGLPHFLHWLGPMRTEFFLGQLTGHEFIRNPSGLVGQYGQFLNPQPFIHGQLISFKPTRNFEFAFYRTTIFGGPGYPFTFHRLISSLFTTGNSPAGSADKPGKRTSGLNFSYRLPYLRNWLTLYGDGFAHDEFSPIAYVDVSAWHAGLYLSHFPCVSRLDLRVEGVYTDVPGGVFANTKQPGSFYRDNTWANGYTNNGDLIGSWVGGGGQGAQAWSNYWFSPRNRLQFNFRHQKVSQEFLPGGGTLTDVGARGDYWVRSNLALSASVQYERWLFPVIQPNAQRNVTGAVGIMFQPEKLFRRASPNTEGNASDNGGRP